MDIIDAQLHLSPGHHPPRTIMSYMSAVGVGRSVLVQSRSAGIDNLAYIERAAADNPERFAVVGLIAEEAAAVDPRRRDVDEIVARWADRDDTVGLRIVLLRGEEHDLFKDGYYDRALRAAERAGVPVFMFALHAFPLLADMARKYPGLRIVIDHLGLPQPPIMVADAPPFRDIGQLLAVAAFENIAVKCTAAPTLSRLKFPFDDIWTPVRSVCDAFGIDRVMWGSDITRVGGLYSYAEDVFAFRQSAAFTDAEREKLMGGTLRSILNWPAATSAAGGDDPKDGV
jgi:L-fuconolactonase